MKPLLITLLIIGAGIGFVLWLPYGNSGFDYAGLRREAVSGSVLSLSDYTPFSWTEVHVYSGYWENARVAKEVGSRRPFPSWTLPQGSSEGSCMLIFKERNRIVSVVALFGEQMSLELRPRRVGTPPIRLRAITNAHGWIHLQEEHARVLENSRASLAEQVATGQRD